MNLRLVLLLGLASCSYCAPCLLLSVGRSLLHHLLLERRCASVVPSCKESLNLHLVVLVFLLLLLFLFLLLLLLLLFLLLFLLFILFLLLLLFLLFILFLFLLLRLRLGLITPHWVHRHQRNLLPSRGINCCRIRICPPFPALLCIMSSFRRQHGHDRRFLHTARLHYRVVCISAIPLHLDVLLL